MSYGRQKSVWTSVLNADDFRIMLQTTANIHIKQGRPRFDSDV